MRQTTAVGIEVDGIAGIASVYCYDCDGVAVFGLEYEPLDREVGIMQAEMLAAYLPGHARETCTCAAPVDEMLIGIVEDAVGEYATRVLITERGA